MAMPELFNKTAKLIKANAPEILTAIGISGVVTTAYLSAKGAFRAADLIEADIVENGIEPDRKKRVIRQAKLVWKEYLPAGVSGAVTIGCILGASKTQGNRTAAAVAAYSLSEKAFSEYKEKVVEQLGEGKEQKIRDEIAQEKVSKAALEGKEVIVIGNGNVLCCELYTNRFFRSDMETLRRAMNDINAEIMRDISGYVSLNSFYDLVGLPPTSQSEMMGWNFEKPMFLQFSTCLSPDNEPCLAFDYNYVKPLYD